MDDNMVNAVRFYLNNHISPWWYETLETPYYAEFLIYPLEETEPIATAVIHSLNDLRVFLEDELEKIEKGER